jgi:hypothetical protein
VQDERTLLIRVSRAYSSMVMVVGIRQGVDRPGVEEKRAASRDAAMARGPPVEDFRSVTPSRARLTGKHTNNIVHRVACWSTLAMESKRKKSVESASCCGAASFSTAASISASVVTAEEHNVDQARSVQLKGTIGGGQAIAILNELVASD